jgi:1-acyl-sn-glycerol-3-phosphate acyltransferase
MRSRTAHELINTHGWTWQARQGAFAVALSWLGRAIVLVAAPALFRLDIERHAPLPEGAKIIAPNHPSTTDPFLITMLAAEQTTILIDDRLFKVPLFGAYLERAGHVPVIPGEGRSAYERARRLLSAGRTMAIFPEGSVSPLDGGFCPPRTGVVRLALSTGAPVIPVGIHLQRDRIRLVETEIEGQRAVGTWYLGGPYAMTVGEPLVLEGDVNDRSLVRALSAQLIQRIIDLSQESAARVESRPAGIGRLLQLPFWPDLARDTR